MFIRNLVRPGLLLLLSGWSAFAQNVSPVVVTAVPGFNAYAGAPAKSIDLTGVFRDPDGSDAVQMTVLLPASTGTFNIDLNRTRSPITVANFLHYVTSGRYFAADPVTHQLASSIIHRSIPNFVIQGGGFIGFAYPPDPTLAQLKPVEAFPPIQNERTLSNLRGTIAMVKVSGQANSATSQWFINLADNHATLDTENGGFAVFGHVAGQGMATVDAVAAIPVFNARAPFESLPLRNFTRGAKIKVSNLVSLPVIRVISPLSYAATSDNLAVVTAAVSGSHLLVAPKAAGTAHVTVTATDLDGAVVRSSFVVNVSAGPARLPNLSTRAAVGTGDNVLIGGFIVSGTTPKRLLIRALGPSLAPFGVPNPLQNPVLQLRDKNGSVLITNDNWGTALNHQDVSDTGRAPGSPVESAILTTLAPGSYTAAVSGAGGTSGVALVEVYDQDSGPGSSLLNLSTRGRVDTGNNVMIGGFVLTGGSRTLVVRSLGPTLTQFGVIGALPDPKLELHNAQGALLDNNDNWQSSPQQAQIQASGFAPPNPAEPALFVTLPPGRYTAVVSGAGATPAGVALVEVYPQ
ncbi:MAG: peptidylprolyl isomerase [Verrucomicrobiota bacterium]